MRNIRTFQTSSIFRQMLLQSGQVCDWISSEVRIKKPICPDTSNNRIRAMQTTEAVPPTPVEETIFFAAPRSEKRNCVSCLNAEVCV